MNWKAAVLSAISALGGEADNQDVFDWLEDNWDIPRHLYEESYDRPNYRHTVRGYLSRLRDASKLERVKRGRYRITEAGRADLAVWRQAMGID